MCVGTVSRHVSVRVVLLSAHLKPFHPLQIDPSNMYGKSVYVRTCVKGRYRACKCTGGTSKSGRKKGHYQRVLLIRCVQISATLLDSESATVPC